MNIISSVSVKHQTECFGKELKINTVLDLPKDSILEIFENLNATEMRAAGGVNKLWNRLASEIIPKKLMQKVIRALDIAENLNIHRESILDCQKKLNVLVNTPNAANPSNLKSKLETLKEGTSKILKTLPKQDIKRLKEELKNISMPSSFKNLMDVVLIVKKKELGQFPCHELLRKALRLNEIKLAESIAETMPDESRKLWQADKLILFSSLISQNKLDEARNIANDMSTSHDWVKSVEAEKTVQYFLSRQELKAAIKTANNIPNESIKISAIKDIADYLISQNNLTATEIANTDLRNRVLNTVANRLTSQDRLEEAEAAFKGMEYDDWDMTVRTKLTQKQDKMYIENLKLEMKVQMENQQLLMKEKQQLLDALAWQQFIVNKK